MLSFDEVGDILDAIADELPQEFFRELNGGIILLPDLIEHPSSIKPQGLLTIGEYRFTPHGLGRYIVIHYGSFVRAYSHLPPERQYEELRGVLLHEFTHHLQSLGGTRDLEKQDRVFIERYRRRHNPPRSQ